MSCAENNGSQNENSSTIETTTASARAADVIEATTTTTATETPTTETETSSATWFDFKCSEKSISIAKVAGSVVDDDREQQTQSQSQSQSLLQTSPKEDVLEFAVATTDMLPKSEIADSTVAKAAVVATATVLAANFDVCTPSLVAATEIVTSSIASSARAVGQSAELSSPPKQTASDAQATLSSSVKEAKMCATKPPIPLPKPTFTSATADSHLPHISSDPTLGVQLRGNHQQQQKMKSYHDAKQNTVWDSSRDSIGGTGTVTVTATGTTIKSGTVSASGSPSMARKSSDCAGTLPRRVSFPKSDNELVTGYLEPANPWEQAKMVKSISELAELYVISCQKHNTKPLQIILDHLKAIELNKEQRQPVLSLKSIKLAPSDCEALEEIFKRVQYKFIDLSSCDLDESATIALFEMIEYYEAANELDISSNARGMTYRGWTYCIYMVSHSEELQVLIARGNPISKQSADGLGSALSTSRLHTLKLEHCGLKGALSNLCYKLHKNRVLKELWLAHNDLDCKDAEAIADLLKANHYLELVDISNNNIKDEGLLHIVEALILQSRELERRSMLHRSAAVDDDDSLSSVEVSQTAELDASDSLSSSGKSTEDDDTFSFGENTTKRREDTNIYENVCEQVPKEKSECIEEEMDGPLMVATASKVVTVLEENDADDDTDDTVKSTNLKNATHTMGGGQSMLDRMLSLNSESSSEEGASNFSTDTIAPCGSEDASIISDDILDVGTTTLPLTTSAATVIANTQTSTQSNAVPETTVAAVGILTTKTEEGASDQQEEPEETDNVLIDLITLEEKEATARNDNSSSSEINNSTSNNSNSNNAINESNNLNNNINNSKSSNDNVRIAIDRELSNSSSGFSDGQDNPSTQQHALRCVGRDATTALEKASIFEVTAGEGDCLIAGAHGNERGGEESVLLSQHPTKAVDVNKNTKLGDEYDDTHSTDSAFESASEGDISRHLPEDYSRLSSSYDGTRIDDIVKGVAIETGTIVTESTEFLADAAATPTSTPTPPSSPLVRPSKPHASDDVARCRTGITGVVRPPTPMGELLATREENTIATGNLIELDDASSESSGGGGGGSGAAGSDGDGIGSKLQGILPTLPKVTIAEDSLPEKHKDCSSTPIPTPPPPSTSPGGASHGLRRTESSSAFITNATRNRSQSSDSLCSDNSLDGSIGSDLNFSTTSQLNEKLTKNDTLTRQQRQTDPLVESTVKSPSGLKALALWNNNLTKDAGYYISDLLEETSSLELLNIGKNCLSNEFVSRIKDSLMKNTTLTTLGLQSAHLSANGIETLASILTFGGNSTLQRLDIRDNKLEVESLTKIAEVLKSNTTITQIDIDDEPKRLSVGSDAHLDYTRVLEKVRSMCSRNEKTQAQLQSDKAANIGGANKRRGGYYMGSRKISLTCHTRPLIETSVVTVAPPSNSNKLDVKRKSGTRLRSPVPSPPTISPSSSPNRSRFQVFRVNEVSPLTSPLAQTPPPPPAPLAMSASNISLSTMPIASCQHKLTVSTILPSSSSLPSMATVTSSTQSIKRMSVSPRSRFRVSKIFEDPHIPLSNRQLPPITPPLNLPPTPLAKHADNDFPSSTACVSTDERKATDLPNRSSTGVDTNSPSGTVTGMGTATVSATTTSSSSSTNDLSHTTKQDSTNATTATNTTTATAQTQSQPQAQNNNTISPLCSSSSSSSSSTSPASLQSSSSTSMSSSLSTIFSTSTSSSPGTDNADSSEAQQYELVRATPTARCPIAVFTDNDITLTKNTVCEFSHPTLPEPSVGQEETITGPATQQRVRKVSWIANPAAVDKLRSLFHNPATIFQRSSSPEIKATTSNVNVSTNINFNTSTTPPTIHLADGGLSGVSPQQQQQPSQLPPIVQQQPNQQNSLLPTRKNSPPTWTKLGTEILSATSTGATNTTTLEQSRSFLDVASRQLRDLGKQVFRQNLNFGNEVSTVGTGGNTTIVAATGVNLDGIGGNDSANGGSGVVGGGGAAPEQHDATLIPTDVKQEIKENISPEHTINEETLQSLQKLSSSSLMSEICVAIKSSATETGVREESELAMSCVLHMDELGPCDFKERSVGTTTANSSAAAPDEETPSSANTI